jgi:hypothetical protein
LTDSIDVHVDPTPNICSAEDESVLIRNEMIYPAGHDTDTSDTENFMKRLTDDAKPMTPGQKRMSGMWILFNAQKNFLKKICGYGHQLFYTMTRTCTTPAYHVNIPPPPPPPMSFCCELLYSITLFVISAALFLSTACALGFAKCFDKLTGVKISCRELLFVFLALFPAPGAAAAATQGLADQSSIQVVVHTNASTSMVEVDAVNNMVDNVTSWAQLVTACAAPSANITLSPTFKMGAYTKEIDFRLVLAPVLEHMVV